MTIAERKAVILAKIKEIKQAEKTAEESEDIKNILEESEAIQ